MKAPFPPEPPLPPAIPPAVPKEPTLRPKEPDYPPPGWVAPTEPTAPGPSPEDLMRQQRLLAEQMYEAARQEGPVMPRMPIFTGPTAPDMTNVWLQQQTGHHEATADKLLDQARASTHGLLDRTAEAV